MTWAQCKPHYTLWPWPEKKAMCKKMKPDTVLRLDQLWADPGRGHKDSDMIKQCRGCQAYFSPGTSSQQLLTHIRKCQGQAIISDFDPAPRRVDSGSYGAVGTPPDGHFHRFPCDDPELIMLIEPVANDDVNIIRIRLRELAAREQMMTQMLGKLITDMSGTHNFHSLLNNFYHVLDAIAALTERLETVLNRQSIEQTVQG
ncbi:hypothetical protein J8273_7816 [Carpediemonas membranifera]|uniref:Uncharacterized protein n=1 Tax=Carpediemonas membranifera TaxID=201153 RepID=A0A8J6ASL7_9EUKA|nr:hypothetical protein J8273_7816 [Carpediemonas membranifera]|eukprot:KAG9390465.1 hypothetical protein J8273_7816 [Carpediemonas membranifera]